MPSRSRLHGARERRGINGTTTFSGWNDSLSVTGVVPPHGYDFLNRAGVNVTPKTVLSIGVVQRCLEVLQNSHFVMGPPRAFKPAFDADSGMTYRTWMSPKAKGYPPLLSSPWGTSVFADKANVAYNIGAGRTVASMGLFGEAWWLTITRTKTATSPFLGRPASLEVLHPSFIRIETTQSASTLKSIKYGMGPKAIEPTPGDLIHIPRRILPGDRSGVSPIQTESPMFAIAIAAVQYSQMWFAQGGQASYVLTTPNKLGDEEINRIFEHLLLEHSGLNQAYQPLILDSGVEPRQVQMTPEKSQMTETLSYARTEIGGYFGVPLHLLGATGDSGNVWGKGIQEENFGLLDFTLSGYRVPIEEAFSAILPGDMGAAINQRALLRANATALSKLVTANRSTAVTAPNEERILQDLLPGKTPASKLITTPLNSNIPSPTTAPAPAPATTATTGAGGGTTGGTGGGE